MVYGCDEGLPNKYMQIPNLSHLKSLDLNLIKSSFRELHNQPFVAFHCVIKRCSIAFLYLM